MQLRFGLGEAGDYPRVAVVPRGDDTLIIDVMVPTRLPTGSDLAECNSTPSIPSSAT